MKKTSIYLKSGQLIETNVKVTKATRGTVTNELTGLTWENGDAEQLMYIRLDDVSAVVSHQAPALDMATAKQAVDAFGGIAAWGKIVTHLKGVLPGEVTPESVVKAALMGTALDRAGDQYTEYGPEELATLVKTGEEFRRAAHGQFAHSPYLHKPGAMALALRRELESTPLSDGERDVLTERHRQISEEGYDSRHDRGPDYDDGQLATAAAAYALHGKFFDHIPATVWPWDQMFFKPRTRRDNLVRAGALILAEIDRLDRAARDAAEEALK